MPKPSKLRAGIGAECDVLLKYAHPILTIKDKYPNPVNAQRLQKCLLIRQEEKTVNRKMQQCYVFRHDEFPDKELHCVARWCKISKEGPEEKFFSPPQDKQASETVAEATNEDVSEVTGRLFGTRAVAEDIANIRRQGLDVDDDNEPAPENIPDANTTTEKLPNGLCVGQVYGWDGVDHRAKGGYINMDAQMKGMPEPEFASYVGIFLIFFPRVLLNEIVLKETNKAHPDLLLTWGELLRFLGLILFMATVGNYNRREFWSSQPISVDHGAPYRFHHWMSGKRFEAIMRCFTITSRSPPSFEDKFWEVREIIEVWNKWMLENFRPSWINCLDESMSIWFNKFTCPGWMFVPRKPHPFGNEYHSIGCGMSTIMWAIELMEGKDRPKEFPSEGGTAGLLLRLCKALYGTGKIVVLDSGFCVLQALIALKNVGVFSAAVIKKRRYWPRYVAGATIDDHMKDKEVGETDSVRGSLENVPYNIFCLKEPDYIMKLMSTYGGLVVKGDNKKNVRIVHGEKKTFFYQEPFANHFLYRHVIDDHNNHRHSHPSIEETWVTHRWPLRVFSFLLAISEINVFLAYRHFVWRPLKVHKIPTIHNFRRNLAMALINNQWIVEEDRAGCADKRKRHAATHDFLTAPPHAKKFCSGNWDVSAKARYQQYACRTPGCKKQVRTYCGCSVGLWMCQSCHQDHVVEVVTTDSPTD